MAAGGRGGGVTTPCESVNDGAGTEGARGATSRWPHVMQKGPGPGFVSPQFAHVIKPPVTEDSSQRIGISLPQFIQKRVFGRAGVPQEGQKTLLESLRATAGVLRPYTVRR